MKRITRALQRQAELTRALEVVEALSSEEKGEQDKSRLEFVEWARFYLALSGDELADAGIDQQFYGPTI